MRKIKFRALCAITGVWRYGFYYVSKGNHIIRNDQDKESIVLSSTVGQFTGLKDKNVKEIYEGDICIIVKAPNMDSIKNQKPFEIRFGKGAQFYGYVDGWLGDSHLYDLDAFQYEIIGNIHETP